MEIRFRGFAVHAGVALLGAALCCAYALEPRLPLAAYVALVPWVVLYTDPNRRNVSPLWLLIAAYICWIVCHGTALRAGPLVPFVVAPFFLPAWLLFPLLLRPIQRLRLPRSIALPIVWVAVEWTRLLLAPGHFDLLTLGYSQARVVPLVQIADITGVYGISFLVAAVNGLLADAWFALKDASWRPRLLLRENDLLLSGAAIAAAFGLAFGYGSATLSSATSADGPRLALLQPDATEGNADLLVRPDTEIRDLDGLALRAARMHTAILVETRSGTETPSGPTTSSACLLGADGLERGRCDKQVLLPFLEYMPLDRAAGSLAPKVQRAYRWLVRKACGHEPTGLPGAQRAPLDLPWKGGSVPFAAVFGAESTYAPIVAESSRRGARIVVNLTGDGETSSILEEPMLRVCALRAIENRLTFVRAGSSSLLGFIDPQGRLRSGASGTVALPTVGTTPYAASHDAFALLCVAITLWLLARSLLRGRPVMTPHPATAEAAAG